MRTRHSSARNKVSGFILTRWLIVVAGIAAPIIVLLPILLYGRAQDLQSKAQTALAAGDTKGATRYATELLANNINIPLFSWDYGNVVYDGNQILGLAALKENDIAKAKQCLLAAGNTPGSPQLDSFGPEMTLAQELLKKGEKQVVLDFLDQVAKFWATPKPGEDPKYLHLSQEHGAKIQQWKNEIRSGKHASLNRFDFS